MIQNRGHSPGEHALSKANRFVVADAPLAIGELAQAPTGRRDPYVV